MKFNKFIYINKCKFSLVVIGLEPKIFGLDSNPYINVNKTSKIWKAVAGNKQQ